MAGRRGSVCKALDSHSWGRGFESGSGHSVSAPQIRGLDDGASGIGQAKSRPTKSDLHLGKFHSSSSHLSLITNNSWSCGGGIIIIKGHHQIFDIKVQ